MISNVEERELGDVAERMRMLVEHSMLSAPEYLFVTVSIGGAQAVPDDTVESLLRRADEKLYQAKSTGKNRVCL